MAAYLVCSPAEPYEYLHSKQEMVLRRVASTAAARVARTYSKQHSNSGSSVPRLNSRQVSIRLLSMTRVPYDRRDGAVHLYDAAENAAQQDVVVLGRDFESSAGKALEIEASEEHSPSPELTAAHHDDQHRLKGMKARELAIQSKVKLQCSRHHDLNDLGCEGEFEEQCQELSNKMKHHLPSVVLLRGHWKGLWLQFFLEAVYGALFYIFFRYEAVQADASAGRSFCSSTVV